MTTGQQERLEQRLDQHAEAVENLFDRVGVLEQQVRELHRACELLHRRIMVLEAAEAQTDDLEDDPGAQERPA